MRAQTLEGSLHELAVDPPGGQLPRDGEGPQGAGPPPGVALGKSPITQKPVLDQALLGRVDLGVRVTLAAKLSAQLKDRVIASDDHPEARVESRRALCGRPASAGRAGLSPRRHPLGPRPDPRS